MVTINCSRYGKKNEPIDKKTWLLYFITGPEWTILSPPSLPPSPPQKKQEKPLCPSPLPHL